MVKYSKLKTKESKYWFDMDGVFACRSYFKAGWNKDCKVMAV